MDQVRVNLVKEIDDSYKIEIGDGIFADELIREIERIHPGGLAVISDSKVYGIYGDVVNEIFAPMELDYLQIHFPEGEQNKNIDTIMNLFSWLAKDNFDRKALIVALGGGVTGDMAGFLAAIYMRGISFIQVPTSLLAMVDSSIGGKTGIDTPEGKNLIGSFHQPKSVIIDIQFLQTLPHDEFINGMSEIIKHAIIYDAEFFGYLENNVNGILSKQSAVLLKMIRRSCEIKAEVVEKDEKEGGLRQILNFGHTVGHAVENASNFAIPHGYAVAIGMVAESFISHKRGILSETELNSITGIIDDYGLLKYLSKLKKIDLQKMRASAMIDKKNKNGQINFVIPEKIGTVCEENGKFSFSMSLEDLDEAIQYCLGL